MVRSFIGLKLGQDSLLVLQQLIWNQIPVRAHQDCRIDDNCCRYSAAGNTAKAQFGHPSSPGFGRCKIRFQSLQAVQLAARVGEQHNEYDQF